MIGSSRPWGGRGAVRGPLSLCAQSDIVTTHQLEGTEGLRYAEMERMIPMVDEATGEPVVDQA